MKLGGLTKTTLLDYPEHVACTLFTLGCNLRCPFCHNASLVVSRDGALREGLTERDFLSFLDSRKGILDGVVVSGGEPLIHSDIEEFLHNIRETGLKIKLDTNGSFPDKLRCIIENDLVDYVAMDVKNSPDKYELTTGYNIISQIDKSIDLLLNSNIDYEFRTTSVRELHTVEDFRLMGKWIEGTKRYFIQCFEDSGDILNNMGFSAPSDSELSAFLAAAQEFVPVAQLRGI